jgi:hypothetical protein
MVLILCDVGLAKKIWNLYLSIFCDSQVTYDSQVTSSTSTPHSSNVVLLLDVGIDSKMVYGVIQNFVQGLKYRGGWRGLLEHMYTVSDGSGGGAILRKKTLDSDDTPPQILIILVVEWRFSFQVWNIHGL